MTGTMKLFKTSLKQIRRTPYQAIIAVLILSLTFFATSGFSLILMGSQSALTYFEKTPQIIAFFEKGKDLPEEEISRIKGRLEATGKMESFEYVSTKQAEQIYKDKNKDDPILNELVDYKILPPSIEVSAIEITYLKDLKEILDQEPMVQDIAYYEDVVGQLSTWISNVRYMGIAMVGFLGLLSVLILMVIIGLKIKNKRPEIEIMRLLGASPWHIHGPFLVEGMIYGAAGALIGWLGTFTVLQYTTPVLIDWLQDVITMPVPIQVLLMLLGIMMLGGMVLGAFGSLMAVRRFSKV
jgi:cell division transport system permease protein